MKTYQKRLTALSLCLVMLHSLCFTANAASRETAYTDTQTHWAREAIDRWSEMGYVSGYPDGSFRPDAPVTAAELCAIVNRMTRYQADYTVASVPEKAWYRDDVSAMISHRMLAVTSSSYEKPISREAAVFLLAKAFCLPNVGGGSFSDSSQIASYARNAIGEMNQRGYIDGYPDRTFRPKNSITRAEIVTILNNMCRSIITQPGTYRVAGGYSYANADHVFVNCENVTLELEGSHAAILIGQNVTKAGSVTVKRAESAPEKMNGNSVFAATEGVVATDLTGGALNCRYTDNRAELATCPAVRADANRYERAAVALGSMLTYNNRLSVYRTLPTDFAHEAYKGAGKEHLNSLSWGILSRRDLLNTVISMTIAGHNDSFLSDAVMFAETSQSERDEFAAAVGTNGFMVQETCDIYQKWGERGIICWDEFRMANLIQWGYNAGYITKDEAYALLEPVLAIVAAYFDTWEEAYDNYLDGYAWWSRSDITNGKERPREGTLDNIFILYPDVFDDTLLSADYSQFEHRALYEKLCNEAAR